MSFGVLALIVGAGLAGPLLSIGRRAYVPVVVGEILAGVAIGRTGGDWLDPSEPTVAFLADVGFTMLMFGVGMHVPIRAPGIARGLRRGAVAAVLVGLLALPAGYGIAEVVGGGDGGVYALLLASGSAAVLLPVLQEMRLMEDDRALVVMSQIAIADVAAIVALPLVLQPSRAGTAALGGLIVLGAGVVVLVGARLLQGSALVHRVRKESKHREWALDLRLALLLIFVLAWVAQSNGTSILVAGFLVGLLVAAIGGPKRLSRQVIGIGAGFFVPLFFVVLGARLDLTALWRAPLLLLAGRPARRAQPGRPPDRRAADAPGRGVRAGGDRPARSAGRRRRHRAAGGRAHVGAGRRDHPRRPRVDRGLRARRRDDGAGGRGGECARARDAGRARPACGPDPRLSQAVGRDARTRVSTASRSEPSTGRRTRSALSITSPGSSAATASGVISTLGSRGPPTPSVRLSRSCPIASRVPPGARAAAAPASMRARSGGGRCT